MWTVHQSCLPASEAPAQELFSQKGAHLHLCRAVLGVRVVPQGHCCLRALAPHCQLCCLPWMVAEACSAHKFIDLRCSWRSSAIPVKYLLDLALLNTYLRAICSLPICWQPCCLPVGVARPGCACEICLQDRNGHGLRPNLYPESSSNSPLMGSLRDQCSGLQA